MSVDNLTLVGLLLGELCLAALLAIVLDGRSRRRFRVELEAQKARDAAVHEAAREAEQALVAGRVRLAVNAIQAAQAQIEQRLREQIGEAALRARTAKNEKPEIVSALDAARLLLGELRAVLEAGGPPGGPRATQAAAVPPVSAVTTRPTLPRPYEGCESGEDEPTRVAAPTGGDREAHAAPTGVA
jgi:hypothetical protein